MPHTLRCSGREEQPTYDKMPTLDLLCSSIPASICLAPDLAIAYLTIAFGFAPATPSMSSSEKHRALRLKNLRWALESLRLISDDDELSLSFDTNYAHLLGTMLEELDEGAFQLSAGATYADIQESAEKLLQNRGYRGDVSDCCAVLEFAAAELQSERILRSTLQGVETGSVEELQDVAFANCVSRLCTALQVHPEEPQSIANVDDLLGVLDSLKQRLAARVEQHRDCVGSPLLDANARGSALTNAQFDQCEQVNYHLREEHKLRRNLLLKRLAVTVKSFGYSEKAKEGEFDHIPLQLSAAVVANEQPVTVFDAFAAKQWLLQFDRVSGSDDAGAVESKVKRVLMGTVPDRGGRIGSAARARGEMPKFLPRVADLVRKKGHAHGRRSGGASRNKGKRG